ncbi:MAG TPA: hypothetical protein VKY89_06280 [Thermoanaerobaculia bacterium]|nr:hypothetical protein [Thermoanaerobaculia bacterium]
MAGGRRDGRAALLFALAALLVYNLNGRVIASSDTLGTRFVPFALLKAGTPRLDPVLAVVQTSRRAYWVQPTRDGGHASLFPIVAPLLATPLYVPAALLLARRGWPNAGLAAAGALMEKLAASTIAAAAAGAMFLLLRRRLPPARALGLAAAFAFGSETWMIGSQALWQHGTEELLLVVALLAFTGPLTAARLAAGGAACGLAIAGRPIDALLVAPFALLAPAWAGRRSAWFFLAAAVPLGLAAAYNLETFGLLGGGYQLFVLAGRRYFEQPMARGLAEMLFSPDKGLFFYTPFLLFLVLLPAHLRRSPADPPPEPPPAGDRALTVLLLAGIVAQLLVYARSEWRGGTCYGPRYLTDMLPLLVWMLAPVVGSLRPRQLALFRWAVGFSIAVQAVGAFCYPRGASDLRIEAEHSRLPAYLIEAPAGIVTPGWIEALQGR